MTQPPKPKAHPTRWQVIIDRGDRFGVRHYDTKGEADMVAAVLNAGRVKPVAFVNPPRKAWAGKEGKT